MAKEEKEFQDKIDLQQKVYDTVVELLKSTTEEHFSKLGFKPVKNYSGEYGTGDKFGTGVETGKYNLRIIGKTKTILEKEIILGAKKTHSFITIAIDANIAKIHYDVTERTVGRFNEDGPLMISASLTIDAESGDMKKEIKKFLSDISKQEVYYISETKLGVEDKVETESIAENTNMSLSFKKLFFGSFEDTENMMDQFINEGKKKIEDEEVDPNHPEIKDTNTIPTDNGTLLFDDSAEETNEEPVSEITSTATAGAFAYSTPFAFKKALKKKNNENKRPILKKEYSSEGFWTKVDIEPLYKAHPIGMPGVEVNSEEELRRSSNGNKPSINESLDLTKRKFIVKEENETLGVNKRYVITQKLSVEEERAKWAKLSGFKLNETIRRAEDIIDECGCPMPETDEEKVTRAEYEEIINKEFAKRNAEEEEFEPMVSAGMDADDEGVVTYEKPDSFIIHKFAKDDFMNENKMFIVDLVTSQYVINPNHKTQK